ncbi:MAG: hypothetical protein DWQ01_03390 [Planctomycetota bacterium]|nr:MAG: hypothetical protein DWQ01_03390 [Planctomycetota bacterium]
MYRLRPLLSCLIAATFCALLEGATTSKVAADAGWAQCVAILMLLSWPVAGLAGLVLALAAPASAQRNRGHLAGLAVGLALFLVPTLMSILGLAEDVRGSWAGFLVVLVAAALWLRWGKPLAGPETKPLIGKFGLAILLAGWLCALVGILTPGPFPAIGLLPTAPDTTADQAPPDSRPNLILVVLDTLRADRLGCYGYSRDTTPFLDALAAEGLLYRQAVAPASHTPPTHASLFTGKMPSSHGVLSTHVGMPPGDYPSLAGRLADSGYQTLAVVANFVLRRAQRFSRGFHLYDDSLVCHTGLGSASEAVTGMGATGRMIGYLTFGERWNPAKLLAVLTRPSEHRIHAADVNARVEHHLQALSTSQAPFFLFLNYMDVHAPYQAPGDFMDRFLEHDPGRFRERMDGMTYNSLLNELGQAWRQGDHRRTEEVAALSDRYDGELAYLDHQLRQLVDMLRNLPGNRPWRLVITSDHGEHFGEHDQMGHALGLWQETQHVPLILHGEGIAAGEVEAPVSLLDLPTTFLAWAGEIVPLAASRLLPGLPPDCFDPTLDLTAMGHQEAPWVWAEQGDPRQRFFFAEIDQLALWSASLQKTYFEVAEEQRAMTPKERFDLSSDPKEEQALTPAREFLGPNPEAWRNWLEAWWQQYEAGRRRSWKVDDGEASRLRVAELGYQ